MREKPGLLDYARRWPLQLWMWLVGLFLYAPLAVLVLMSFNDSRRTTQWRGFTLDWYRKVFEDAELVQALMNSLTIAALSTALSVVLGTLAALALWRFRFPGKPLVDGAFSLPIVVPEICMGVAMLIFFARVMPWPPGLPWPLSLGAIVIAHVAFSFPFVAVVVRARLGSFDRSQEEAARDLGASQWQAMWDVVIPHLRPALLAGALLAFTLSLDDFVITFFTAGPDTLTFPVKVYSMVRFSVTPKVNAISTLLLLFTIILTFIALRLQARAETEQKH
ncbi:ABC transporter permease [Sandaracinobacter sp. RS1-74]|uniref:ABC transporter permease n=1 Tax=Sandaracinobacteroides sayramensis TaxID=2913411 RepID=UPI001EDB9DC1|nr:ABC transporter permease [Sandaracinobacteroides sayramensis]MCG2839742.1 ABC transporter permease [Sandaracinobacteroides sayramensis]